MKRFKNLLLVVPDGDTDAGPLLSAALHLAETNDADLTVFSVVDRIPEKRRFLERNQRRIDLERLIVEARFDDLEEMTPASSVPVSYEVVSGIPHLAIIERVAAHGHDLVVTAPETRRKGLWSSSTTMHLLRKCPVPVWVHSTDSPAAASVVVAVGPLDAGEPTDGLNVKLLELGSSLAKSRQGELHVVHAWRLEGETMLRSRRLSYSSSRIDEMAAEVLAETEQGLQRLLAGTGITADSATLHLRKGHAADVVTDVLAEVNPGTVVMGTVARTGIPGMIIGNTAERVLGSLTTSILAAKPYGLVSPVEALRG